MFGAGFDRLVCGFDDERVESGLCESLGHDPGVMSEHDHRAAPDRTRGGHGTHSVERRVGLREIADDGTARGRLRGSEDPRLREEVEERQCARAAQACAVRGIQVVGGIASAAQQVDQSEVVLGQPIDEYGVVDAELDAGRGSAHQRNASVELQHAGLLALTLGSRGALRKGGGRNVDNPVDTKHRKVDTTVGTALTGVPAMRLPVQCPPASREAREPSPSPRTSGFPEV